MQLVWERVSTAGWWFASAFAAYVGTTAASTGAWRSLLDRRAGVTPSRMFAAAWCGESVNFVLPGGAPGEIAKGALLRDHVAPGELAISLALYNWLSGLMIFATVMGCSLYALLWTNLPEQVALVTLASGVALASATAALRFAFHRRALQPLLSLVRRLPLVDFDLARASERAGELDRRLKRMWHRDRRRLASAFGFMLLARVCTVAEVYLLLAGLAPEQAAPSLLDLSLLVQAATQVVLYASMFVPGQIGAMEGGTAAVFALLGLGAWLGLAVELCRRARKLLAIAIAAVLWLLLRHRRLLGRACLD